MHNLSVKRRATSFLLVLAMLVVSVAALLPVATSADAPEIQGFGVQRLAAADLKNDDDTALRFVFTIGKLDYDCVGIIISKSVATPTYNAANCVTYETTTVHSSIVADGDTIDAPDGRFYVACKLTGIPHSYFDSSLYIRAFVKDGEGTRYSDTAFTSVCHEFGHDSHVETWDAEGTATLQTVGDLTCTCPECGLEVTFTDVTRTPVIYDSENPDGPFVEDGHPLNYSISKTAGEIRGDKHFYPTTKSVGADDGNDLWFEYSFLWNDSLYYRDTPADLAEIRLFCFRDTTNHGKFRGFYYLYLRNNNDGFKTSGDCPFQGHIDYSTYLLGCSPDENCADDLTSLGNKLNGTTIGRYAAGWSGGRGDSPYLYDSSWQTTGGWHRLGFRYHQEVESVAGSTVNYAGYTELYIDGILCWRVHTNMSRSSSDSLYYQTGGSKNRNLLLWTANASDGKITSYSDNDNVSVEMMLDNVANSSQSVFLAVGDIYWTCGDGFVLPVARTDTPASQTIELGGDDYDGGFYYTESPVGKTTVISTDKSSATFRGEYKTLTDIRGDDHFYPDASNSGEGRNLYFEYDFLWNDSLYNWDRAASKAEIKIATIQTSTSNHREFYYLYTRNNGDGFTTSGDCPYVGHFDYSTYKEGCSPEKNCADDLTSEGHYLFGDLVGRYAAGWEGGREDSPYIYDDTWTTKGGAGWHRIGVLVHQEASLDGSTVVYSGWTELFINGVKVWRVQTQMSTLTGKGLTLFTAAKDGSNLVYTDAADNVRIGYQFDGFQSSTNYAYAVFANVNWRIVDVDFDPASEISPVNNPSAASFTLPGGQIVSGKVFYTEN